MKKSIFSYVVIGLSIFTFTSTVSAKLINSVQHGAVVSFFMDSPSRVEQYDLANRVWGATIQLPSTNGVLSAGWIDDDGIYAAFGLKAYRFDLAGNQQTNLMTSSQTIFQIFSDDNLLFLNRSGSLYARFTSISKESNAVIASFQNYVDSVVGASIAPGMNKIFGRSSGVSPSDITYVSYRDDGTFITGGDSPHHGAYPSASKTWTFPDEGKVVDSSGTVYSASSLTYLTSFGSSITDLTFYGGEIPVVLQGNTLTAYTKSILPTGSATLDHTPVRIFIDGEEVITFSEAVGMPHGMDVRMAPLADLNPPVPGEPLSPKDLPFSPNSCFVDRDGILLLFSKANQSIFRWDSIRQKYVDTIPLVGVPEFAAYSSESHKIYTAYDSGLIREISLDDTDFTEHVFASIPQKPRGLSTAGSYVFAEDASGAWDSHYTFGPDGTRIDAVDWNYYSSEYIWSDANQKMYFFRDGTSPNDLLWEQINADGIRYPSEPAGGIGQKKDSPLHSSSGFVHPIRVAPDGSVVVLGSGVIHDAETLARLPLSLTNSVNDIAWIGNDVYTVRTLNGSVQYQKWIAPNFDAVAETQYPGTAKYLLSVYDEAVVGVSLDASGVPVFQVLNADLEVVPPIVGELTLEAPVFAAEGDGVLSGVGRVMVEPAPVSNLVVTIAVSDAAKLSAPEEIIIPAGESNVLFDITILDDSLLDGTRTTSLQALSRGYFTGKADVIVHDNESAVLMLSLPQTAFEGMDTIRGAVQVDRAPDVDVTVQLISNNPDEVGGGTVVIPAGQTMVSFALPVIDDAKVDGVQTATITAHVENWRDGVASVFVVDNETNGIDLRLPTSVMEGDGVLTNAGSVVLSGTVPRDVSILLSVSDTTELSLPAFVTVPAGQSEVAFDVSVVDDNETDGMQQVSVLAESPDYIPSMRKVAAGDNEISSLEVNLPTGDFEVLELVEVSILAKNIDGDQIAIRPDSLRISADGARGAIPVSPSVLTNNVKGIFVESVTFGRPSDYVQLFADDGNGHTGTSTVFNVIGSELVITTESLTNVLVAAGESSTRMITISNAGNAELEFEIKGAVSAGSPRDQDLILHYTFNEGVGAEVVDHSGNGNDGSAMNEFSYVDGIEGKGIRVVGNSSSYSSAGGHVLLPQLDLEALKTSGLTMSVWVKEEQTWGESYLTLGRTYFGHYGTNIYCQVSDHAVSFPFNSQDVDRFSHYALTYDNGTMKVYRNGTLELEYADEMSADDWAAENLALGRHWINNGADTATRFVGVFDDVRVYKRALSVREIQELYAENDTGLLALYSFNGDANDESGNGHDGVVIGATLTTDRFGNANSAYDFNGSSAYINCGNIINGLSNFTVSAWVNIDRFSNSRYMGPWSQMEGRYNTTGTGNYTLYTGNDTSTGCFGTSMRWDDGIGIDTRTPHAVPLNAWHLITQTYDGNEVRQYDNGILVNATATGAHALSSGWDFLIGKTYSYPGYLTTHFFDGQIDDLRISDRALTEEEILSLYRSTDGGTPTPLAVNAVVADAAGLMAHYPFDGNANDASGNGYNGTVSGATLTTDRSDVADSAYAFDGVDDFISVDNCLGTERTTFTVSTWMNSANPRYQILVSKKPSGIWLPGQWQLFVNATQVSFGFSDGIDVLDQAIANLNLHDGEWHHVCGVLEEDHSLLYVDGNVVATNTAVIMASQFNSNIDIGNRSNTAGRQWFDGILDDVRIYNRALSGSEISDLYNETNDDTGLIASYTFDGNANDESGNGHDGLVHGAVLTVDRFGNAQGAYHFDGVDDYISILDHEGFTVSSVSVVAWVKTSNKDDFKHFVSCYGTGMDSPWYNLYLASGSGFARWAADPGGPVTVPSVTGGSDIADGAWHQVVGVRDIENSLLSIYVDGRLQSTAPDPYASVLDPEVDIWLGGQNGFPARFFEGDIDDVAIYNRVLSAEEIDALYNEDESGDEGESGKSWLRADQNSGTVAPGASLSVSLEFNAAGLTAGDHSNALLTVTSNDAVVPSNAVPVSMYVIPPAPVLEDIPIVTRGDATEVNWAAIDGPVSFFVEVSEGSVSNVIKDSGWIVSTNYVAQNLTNNAVYYYRAKASVDTSIGLLAGAWSEWVSSEQYVNLSDLDDDYIPNWWELDFFGGIRDCDPDQDADGDGQSNLEEYLAGMNPTNAASYFKIESIDAISDGTIILSWNAVTGRYYDVCWRRDISVQDDVVMSTVFFPVNSYTGRVMNATDSGFYYIDAILDDGNGGNNTSKLFFDSGEPSSASSQTGL